MIKKTTILKEATELHKYCDVCGVEIRIGLACSVVKCGYCKKDLCEKCIGHEEPSWGDYRGQIWCNQCWIIGDEYRPIIEQHISEVERLYEEWQKKCNV
jgi:hypothetical protein